MEIMNASLKPARQPQSAPSGRPVNCEPGTLPMVQHSPKQANTAFGPGQNVFVIQVAQGARVPLPIKPVGGSSPDHADGTQ
jgi:hypothetical protein